MVGKFRPFFPTIGKIFRQFSNDWKKFSVRFWKTKRTKRTTKQAENKTVRQFRQFPTIFEETTWTTRDNSFMVRRLNGRHLGARASCPRGNGWKAGGKKTTNRTKEDEGSGRSAEEKTSGYLDAPLNFLAGRQPISGFQQQGRIIKEFFWGSTHKQTAVLIASVPDERPIRIDFFQGSGTTLGINGNCHAILIIDNAILLSVNKASGGQFINGGMHK